MLLNEDAKNIDVIKEQDEQEKDKDGGINNF